MNAVALLAIIATIQAVFLAALVAFLIFRRRITQMARLRVAGHLAVANDGLRRWAAGSESIEPLVGALRALPREAALEFAAEAAATSLGSEAANELATALSTEPWMRKTVGMARSRQWWRRRQAARALAIVGTSVDRPALERLLGDKQPAVAVIAVAALPRIADEALVGRALDAYPFLPPVVRRFMLGALGQVRSLVGPALLARLGKGADPRAIARWVGLAADLQLSGAVDRAAVLDDHADPRVRRQVARALASRPSTSSLATLGRLVCDADADVRAAAARSLGHLGSPMSVDALVTAAHDPAWSVRYGSALALAQLGERGRTALGRLRAGDDRFVADMATLISGLGDGALLELVAE